MDLICDPRIAFLQIFRLRKVIGLPGDFLLIQTVASMRKNLISFAVAAGVAFVPACLFGVPQASSLAYLLVEKGYTPLTMKRAGNEFYVPCKLNGRSASLIVDTGASSTVISSGLLRSVGMSLTKGEKNVYGMMGLAGKNIAAGDIKDFQVGPYQAGAHSVGAWDFSSFRSTPGTSGMDGLLGIDFLHRHQAIIDCFQMHLFLKSRSKPSASGTLSAGLKAGGCTEIPMRPVSHHGLTVPARINGRSGYLVVDTGASHTLLSQHAIAGLNMRLASPVGFGKLGAPDIGKHMMIIQMAHFTTMEIGNFSVPPQWVGVVDLPQSKSGETDDVFFGYLGDDLLACYVGIIDCAALKLFLRFDPIIDAARRRKG
jgi:predicted aspartyl protease